MTLEETVKQMRDTHIVMGEMQVRQARVQKSQAEELDKLRALMQDGFTLHERRMKDLDERILKLVSGIGELLRKR